MVPVAHFCEIDSRRALAGYLPAHLLTEMRWTEVQLEFLIRIRIFFGAGT